MANFMYMQTGYLGLHTCIEKLNSHFSVEIAIISCYMYWNFEQAL